MGLVLEGLTDADVEALDREWGWYLNAKAELGTARENGLVTEEQYDAAMAVLRDARLKEV